MSEHRDPWTIPAIVREVRRAADEISRGDLALDPQGTEGGDRHALVRLLETTERIGAVLWDIENWARPDLGEGSDDLEMWHKLHDELFLFPLLAIATRAALAAPNASPVAYPEDRAWWWCHWGAADAAERLEAWLEQQKEAPHG